MKYLRVMINTDGLRRPKGGRIYISNDNTSWDKFIDFEFTEVREKMADFGVELFSQILEVKEENG
jgi:hypothetical protein